MAAIEISQCVAVLGLHPSKIPYIDWQVLFSEYQMKNFQQFSFFYTNLLINWSAIHRTFLSCKVFFSLCLSEGNKIGNTQVSWDTQSHFAPLLMSKLQIFILNNLLQELSSLTSWFTRVSCVINEWVCLSYKSENCFKILLFLLRNCVPSLFG